MARRAPLIAPGSVLAARAEPPYESVMDDVVGGHRRRKGIEDAPQPAVAPVEESAPEVATAPVVESPTVELLESQNVRKSESLKESNISGKKERKKENQNEEGTVEAATLRSIRPGPDLAPWGTRLPKALKKRLDYQAFRLKESKVTGQGLTVLALERLLTELEALEEAEG